MKMVTTLSGAQRVIPRILFLFLVLASGLQGRVWAQGPAEEVTINCELACYADYDNRLIPAEATPTNLLETRIFGIVMSVITPTNFAGMKVAFCFDGLFSGTVRSCSYKPGVIYEGEVHPEYIGNLGFKHNPGFFPKKLKGPFPRGTPAETRQLLFDENWGQVYERAFKGEFSKEEIFRVLYGVFADTSRPKNIYWDQLKAARILRESRPVCPLSAKVAVRETFANWDEAVGDWPLYLRECFGRNQLLALLAELEKDKLTDEDKEKIDCWRYWLRAQ